MNDADKAMIGKVLAGKISPEEFRAIIRRAVQAEIAALRVKINQNSEKERTGNHVRSI